MDRGKTICTFKTSAESNSITNACVSPGRSPASAAEHGRSENTAAARPSVIFGRSPASSGPSRRGAPQNAGRYQKHTRKFGQLILLGICTAAFMLLFVFRLMSSEDTLETIAVMRTLNNRTESGSEEQGENTEFDQLGRLQLVDLPSLIQVFSPASRPILPLDFDRALIDEDSNIARIYAPSGTEVVSVLPGIVKAISTDEKLGGYVSVRCDNDIDIYYYGLTDILVEQGQPILQNSTLGRVANDILCLRVLKSGRPVDPLDFLGIRAEIG